MLLFQDSVDYFTDPLQRYDSNLAISIGAFGRFGTNGFRNSRADRGVGKILAGGGRATLIAGFAFRFDTFVTGEPIFVFTDAGTEQVRICLDATSHLQVKRGATVLGTGPTVIAPSVFNYIELKVLFSPTVGTVELRLNGSTTPEITLTGQNTRSTANSSADGFKLGFAGAAGAGFNQDYDDIVVMDTSGSLNNDFLGDVRVQYVTPNANGTSSQFVGQDGNSVDNYLLVDEATSDDETTYVESGTVGNQDTYALSNIAATTGVIRAVSALFRARKTDAGLRTLAAVVRSGGSEDAANMPDLAATYALRERRMEQNPITAAAWTVAEVNALEVGPKVAA